MSTPGDSGSGARGDPNADAERDAWLRQALRHAPDADAGAPQAVSDAILRQARQATANATTAAAPSAHRPARVQPTRSRPRASATRGGAPWTALWSWLVQPRVAAGFASLMVATLVGVMWWGRPMDDVLTEARAPLDAPLAARVEAPAPPATVAAPAAPMPREPEATKAAAITAPKGANEDRLAMKRSVPAAASSTSIDSKRSERDRLQAAAAPPVAEAKREAEVPAENPAPAGRADAGSDAASPSSANVPEQAGAPAAPTARERTERSPQAQDRSKAIETALSKASAAGNLSLADRLAPEPARTAPLIDNPASRLRAAVAAWPEVWTWRRGSGTEQPMNDDVQAWLARLDDAARSRWQSAPTAGGTGDPRPLRLFRNGRLHTTVRVDAGTVRLESGAGGGTASGMSSGSATPSASAAPAAVQAPLAGAAATALKAALEQAAP